MIHSSFHHFIRLVHCNLLLLVCAGEADLAQEPVHVASSQAEVEVGCERHRLHRWRGGCAPSWCLSHAPKESDGARLFSSASSFQPSLTSFFIDERRTCTESPYMYGIHVPNTCTESILCNTSRNFRNYTY